MCLENLCFFMYKHSNFAQNNINFMQKGDYMKKKIIVGIVLLLLTVTFVTALLINNAPVVEAFSKYGSSGTEVISIQEKLKRWGYYSGSVDGIYGSLTVSAV